MKMKKRLLLVTVLILALVLPMLPDSPIARKTVVQAKQYHGDALKNGDGTNGMNDWSGSTGSFRGEKSKYYDGTHTVEGNCITHIGNSEETIYQEVSISEYPLDEYDTSFTAHLATYVNNNMIDENNPDQKVIDTNAKLTVEFLDGSGKVIDKKTKQFDPSMWNSTGGGSTTGYYYDPKYLDIEFNKSSTGGAEKVLLSLTSSTKGGLYKASFNYYYIIKNATTTPMATSTPNASTAPAPTSKPSTAPVPTAQPTSAPVSTTEPTYAPEPTYEPSPTTDPGGTSVTITSPKFITKFTHNYNVYNVSASNGYKVTITPLNKLAKSKSVKWIKNGKVAKIRWKKKCKKGKYKFRATTEESDTWHAGYYEFEINCN